MLFHESISIFCFILISLPIESICSNICVYAICDPVDDFLASSTHVISNCDTCLECKQANFSVCTLVHTKDPQPAAHCACGNTLPTTCEADRYIYNDLLNKNASLFEHEHDYMCTFSLNDAALRNNFLPHLQEVNIPRRVNETGSFRVPIEALDSRRYQDLTVRTFSFYLLRNESDAIAQSNVWARVQLSEEDIPESVEPDDGQINVTEWPKVTFRVPPNLPSIVGYSIDYPLHYFALDPDANSSVALNVSHSFRQLTPIAPVSGPNYTLIVLIVVGIILLIGLLCAAISCRDKIKHRRHQRNIKNQVASIHDPETGKSVLVAGHPQTYTVVKNGSQVKIMSGVGGDEREKVHLLKTSESPKVEASTLPLSRDGLRDQTTNSSSQPHIGSSAVAGPKSLDNTVRSSGSKPDIDPNRRTPASIEADRRKYLSLAKDATVIRAADLDLLESIGAGEFGVIRRGYVFDRTEAMIHCLRPPHRQANEAAAEALTERLEASIKAGFHPHIVSLLGLCHEADVLYVCLQLETGPNLRNMLRESRSLDQFLQYTNARGRLSLMSPQRLLNIILGIARGMGHLEECQVLHDNLASVNIVICDNGSAKIAGFGMATLSDLYMRQLEKNHDQLRWLPPETHDTGLFTMRSQTWSFGVVLWEIVTFGGTPYYDMDDDQVVQRVADGYRLARPSNCSRQLYDLMEQCWRANGEDRPDFLTIQQHIQELNLDPELHVSVTYHDGFRYQPIRENWNT